MEWIDKIGNIALAVLVLWNAWEIVKLNKRIQKLEKDKNEQ